MEKGIILAFDNSEERDLFYKIVQGYLVAENFKQVQFEEWKDNIKNPLIIDCFEKEDLINFEELPLIIDSGTFCILCVRFTAHDGNIPREFLPVMSHWEYIPFGSWIKKLAQDVDEGIEDDIEEPMEMLPDDSNSIKELAEQVTRQAQEDQKLLKKS